MSLSFLSKYFAQGCNILGNYEISRKSLKYLKLMASTQPKSEKTIFSSCFIKLQKISCKIFYRKFYLTNFWNLSIIFFLDCTYQGFWAGGE